jgi:SAM-dependent methyltransferase
MDGFVDRARLESQRRRAVTQGAVTFLRDAVRTEVEDRLAEVNRRFTTPAVVTGFPGDWDWPVVVPDTEVLALTPGAHDLVVHDLALHWAADPVGQLVQMRHALRPDGLMMATLFGGQTLHELRACLAEAEIAVTEGLSPRVAPMGEIRDLGALLQRAGFALPVADAVPFDVSYATAFALMRDLRGMGEGNALARRLRGFTRRDVFLRAAEIYAARFGRGDGRIVATFEVIVLTGWAPGPGQQQPLRPGSAAFRLAEALGAEERPLDRGGD